MDGPLSVDATPSERALYYRGVVATVDALLEGEDDWVTAMATVACELHHAFDYFHWTGFYRVVGPRMLAVGPYQGGHGCLRIPFERGVCGAAARTQITQRIDDVDEVADHIACSSTTRSELVVPVVGPRGVFAVLDVDSDLPAAFTETDAEALEGLAAKMARRFG